MNAEPVPPANAGLRHVSVGRPGRPPGWPREPTPAASARRPQARPNPARLQPFRGQMQRHMQRRPSPLRRPILVSAYSHNFLTPFLLNRSVRRLAGDGRDFVHLDLRIGPLFRTNVKVFLVIVRSDKEILFYIYGGSESGDLCVGGPETPVTTFLVIAAFWKRPTAFVAAIRCLFFLAIVTLAR